MSISIDGARFREVLGHYPTGVTLVTALEGDEPVSMVIGSFASVSLDPPLVLFLPAKDSTTWPKIEAAGSFCVNVLADDQLELCNSFFGKDPDPWAGISWSTRATGAPVVDGCSAYVDCVIDAVHEAGDHWIVLGAVQEIDVAGDGKGPLVFFQGGYGGFSRFED